MNKKSKVVLLSAVLASALVAAEAPKADLTAPTFSKAPYKYKKKSITANDGSFHGYLRVHHIFDDDADSVIGKVTGSTIGLGLGYGGEIAPRLKLGGEFYGVSDTGLTDNLPSTGQPKSSNTAFGMFMNTVNNGNRLDTGYTWGANLTYEGKGYKAKLGRTQYDSPLTNIVQVTHVPNMYEYARVDTELLAGKVSVGFINQMSYGSRSQTDYSLIGEGTGTGGMYLNGLTSLANSNAGREPQIIRGDYYQIEDTLTAGTTNSQGILQLGYEKKKGMWQFSIWDQYVDDVANNIYAQGSRKFPLGKGKAIKLSAHIWDQDISNSNYDTNFGGTLIGAEGLIKLGKVVGKFAYESKDKGGLLNAWGANPGYTSSIFSRNQYRSNVDAYKATFVYKPMKGLKLVASYADYGQSDMTLSNAGTVTSQEDATERDLVLVYMPRPDLSFKLFNAKRVSEFNRATQKRTMDHTRLIANLAF